MKPKTKLMRRIAFSLVVIGVLLIVSGTSSSYADDTPPYGVDHLRGRWDGTVEDLRGTDQPFTLLLSDFAPDPDDSTVALVGGCLAIGETGLLTPVVARAVNKENGNFELKLFGTVASAGEVFNIGLTGLVETFGPEVSDDRAAGGWVTAEADGEWNAFHHDRRRPECPAVELDDGLSLRGDVYAAVTFHPDDSQSAGTILEVYTNLASSAVKVDLPDGSSQVLPLFTDIFTPQVDFVELFRFVDTLDGFPVPQETYNFTLLDPLGEPIGGATTSDVWMACTVLAPRNVSATVVPAGIRVEWDPVDPSPGFDPGGTPSLGFYQIELGPENGGSGNYGASGIRTTTSHLIPQAPFDDPHPGDPDGFDFGSALDELVDGTYGFSVIAFAETPPSSSGTGLECQVRASDERVLFSKVNGEITFP